MLTLNVEGYCHNCAHFKAKTETNINIVGYEEERNTTITCANSDICQGMFAYLMESCGIDNGGGVYK